MGYGTVLLALMMRLLLAAPTQARTLAESPGYFSRSATEIWGHYGETETLEIKSPDGTKRIVADYRHDQSEHLTVYLESEGGRFCTDIGEMFNSEVLWSPDSQAFAVTFSDGGSVGTYHTRIYIIEKEGARVEDPTGKVEKRFSSHKLVCFTPEAPNIGAICWMGSSSRLLLAAEIPPHSNCDNFGTFEAFEVSLPSGRILRTYGQVHARRLFGRNLGSELENSDDGCFLKPKSCRIPALHAGH